jgi:hypothetical protein
MVERWSPFLQRQRPRIYCLFKEVFSISKSNPLREILTVQRQNFPDIFNQKNQVKVFLKSINHSCPICILDSNTCRSKKFDSTKGLRLHVERKHAGFYDPITDLSYSKLLEILKVVDTALFLKVVT